MERQVIHIDVNSFAVSVARIKDASLRGRPLVVAYPRMERSLVHTASQEARACGIRPGIPLNVARKLCRELMVISPDPILYARASQAIYTILTEFSPIVEPVGYGSAYLDMTGTTRLFGITRDAAYKLQQEIVSRLRLESTAGVASNKLVSKIASAVIQPVSLQNVISGAEEKFIAPFRVGYLPGIDQQIKQQLVELNIQRIRDIASLSLSHLTTIFGRIGIRLYQVSHGIDKTPVNPPRQIPMLLEECTLADDSNDLDRLRAELYGLIERGALRLRLSQRTTQKIVLDIEYSDHKKAYGQKKLPRGTYLDRELFYYAESLMERVLQRRTRVRRLAVRYAVLAPAVPQGSLFTSKQEQQNIRLTDAVDRIRLKYGANAIRSAMGMAASCGIVIQ
ncbi:DNA polymerase IV [candidate division KSB1 bacterium]|nr:DNA polymerase IV [candidate division KSB1 bacterium]